MTYADMYYAPKQPPRAELQVLTKDRKITLFELDLADVNSGYEFDIKYDHEGNIKKVTILADVNEEVYGLYRGFDDDIIMGHYDYDYYDDDADQYGDRSGYRG